MLIPTKSTRLPLLYGALLVSVFLCLCAAEDSSGTATIGPQSCTSVSLSDTSSVDVSATFSFNPGNIFLLSSYLQVLYIDNAEKSDCSNPDPSRYQGDCSSYSSKSGTLVFDPISGENTTVTLKTSYDGVVLGNSLVLLCNRALLTTVDVTYKVSYSSAAWAIALIVLACILGCVIIVFCVLRARSRRRARMQAQMMGQDPYYSNMQQPLYPQSQYVAYGQPQSPMVYSAQPVVQPQPYSYAAYAQPQAQSQAQAQSNTVYPAASSNPYASAGKPV
jgi:hypothetical protein